MGYIKTAEELPGDYGFPYIGEAQQMFTKRQSFYLEKSKKYGSGFPFKTQVMGKKIAVFMSSNANQLVLSDQLKIFSSKKGWSILEPFFDGGLLLLDGEQHQTTRKLMYPAFQKQSLENYFNKIQKAVDLFVEKWASTDSINLIHELRQLSLFIACRLFLGIETERIPEISHYFLSIVEGMRTIVQINIPFTKFGRALEGRQKLRNFVRATISQKRKNLDQSQDVLGLLLATTDETGKSLTDEEIINQVLSLLFGGHETTAKLLFWTLLELYSHPIWIEKLTTELNHVVANNVLDVSHLRHLLQMNNVLKEVERLHPPVYSIPREVVADVECEGYLIPAGWYVILSPLLTHRLPEIYSNPELFDPERFAPPREEDRQHRFSLIGFGGGTHKCIGQELALMEAKIILSTLLRNFTWSIISEYSDMLPIVQPNKNEKSFKAQFKKLGK